MASISSKAVSFFFKLIASYRTGSSINTIRLRDNIEKLAKWAPPVPGITTTKKNIEGIPSLEIHSNKLRSDQVILYLHGGAYNICSYNTHKRMVSHMAKAAKTPALIINYRKAPEHPFPAALDDALTAYKYLLNKNYKHIILAGDSAGGGLAFALFFKIREEQLPPPRCLVALSPWMDLTFAKWHEEHDDMLHKNKLEHSARNYYDGHPPDNPYISPLFGDFTGLPPVLIQLSASEILYNEVMLAAEKMERQGVPVTLQLWEDVVHVWQAFAFAPEARQAIRKIGEFIRAQTN